MDNFHVRAVFFVRDAPRSLDFYTKSLGFRLDWTKDRPGHGRVFIGLSDDQLEAFRKHIADHAIETEDFHWGAPTTVIRDLDRNELFFWLPRPESSP